MDQYGEDTDAESLSPLGRYDAMNEALEETNFSVSTTSIPISNTPLPQRQRLSSTRNRVRDGTILSKPTTTCSLSSQHNEIDSSHTELERHATISLPDLQQLNSKRKRADTSSTASNISTSSTHIIQQQKKKSCISEYTLANSNLHVSFDLQMNNGSHDMITAASSHTVNAATSDHQAQIHHSTSTTLASHDAATDTDTKGPRAIINPMAEPMWLATRKHVIAEQKATLRHQHLKTLLDDKVMPVEFLGAEKLHRYYASADGKLSTPMMALLGEQATAKAELVQQELEATALWHKKRARYYMELVLQIYTHEEDDTFEESKEGITRVLTFFKKSEVARLETLATKERARQPHDEEAMTNLVCMPEQRPQRETSRGRKRARNSNPASRTNTPTPVGNGSTSAPAGPAPSVSNLPDGPQGQGPSNQQGRQQPARRQGQSPRRGRPGQNNQPRWENNRPPTDRTYGQYNNNACRPQQQQQQQNQSRQQNQGPRRPQQQQQQQAPRPQQQHSDNNQRPGGRSVHVTDSTDKLLSALAVLKDYMG